MLKIITNNQPRQLIYGSDLTDKEKEEFDYALFLPWFFKPELIERYRHLKEKGVKFIFPLPEFEIV